MSRIRSKNTKPEIIIRKLLFKNGFRYRLNVKNIQGSPDIVIHKYKTIIFVNGCFWHGHKGCGKFVIPKTRTEWWLEKISKNTIRDKKNINALRKEGWKVITLWECQIKNFEKTKLIKKLIEKIIS